VRFDILRAVTNEAAAFWEVMLNLPHELEAPGASEMLVMINPTTRCHTEQTNIAATLSYPGGALLESRLRHRPY
jgi:hypothetical protein